MTYPNDQCCSLLVPGPPEKEAPDPEGDVGLIVDLKNPSLLEQAHYDQAHPLAPGVTLKGWVTSKSSDRALAPHWVPVIPRASFRASSKVLSSTSSYFRRLLGGQFKEACELKANGTVTITVDTCATPAITIILNILHATDTYWVPHIMPFEWVLEITFLVDKWGCRNALEFHHPMWLTALEVRQPDISKEVATLPYWAFLARFWGHRALFRRVVEAMVRKFDDDIRADGLPLPTSFLVHVNSLRCSAISRIVHEVYERYWQLLECSGGYRGRCLGKSCDCNHLGALVKLMHSTNIGPLGSEPEEPYVGVCYDFLMECVLNSGTPWSHGACLTPKGMREVKAVKEKMDSGEYISDIIADLCN